MVLLLIPRCGHDPFIGRETFEKPRGHLLWGGDRVEVVVVNTSSYAGSRDILRCGIHHPSAVEGWLQIVINVIFAILHEHEVQVCTLAVTPPLVASLTCLSIPEICLILYNSKVSWDIWAWKLLRFSCLC